MDRKAALKGEHVRGASAQPEVGASRPERYNRRILLAVTGLSPQVVTETLYALSQGTPAFVPTEVHIITTSEGAERVRLTLLGADPGWLSQLRQDYGLPEIAFDTDSIHVLRDRNGEVLEDISTPADNERTADQITETIRNLTADPATAVHVSVAGGRKTMGFYAGYALSLFGRSQDRLSHVLVTPRYESHPDFYYPTPYSRVIYTPPPDSRPLDTHLAEVKLAEIPFVSLRHGLDERLLEGQVRFSDAVTAARRSLAPPRILIDTANRSLVCGDTVVAMRPADLAFYVWLARRHRDGRGPAHWTDSGVTQELLDEYETLVGRASGAYERMEEAVASGLTKEYFEQRKAKTNRALKNALGNTAAAPYLIQRWPGQPYSRFGLSEIPRDRLAFQDEAAP